MAPLPVNGTARLFLDYTSQQIAHTVLFRVSGTPDVSVLASTADTLGDWLKTMLPPADSVVGARYSADESDFTLPLSFIGREGTMPNALWAEDPESAFMSFCGRGTTSGRRWRVDVFTPVNIAGSWPSNNRYETGESSVIDSVHEALRLLVEPGDDSLSICTIASDPIAMYSYTNIAKSAYWQRQQRKA